MTKRPLSIDIVQKYYIDRNLTADEVAKKFDVSANSVRKFAHRNGLYKGSAGRKIKKKWKWSKESKENLRKRNHNKQPIISEKDGKIQFFDCVMDACRKLGLDERTAHRVLNGTYRHTKGYKLQRAENGIKYGELAYDLLGDRIDLSINGQDLFNKLQALPERMQRQEALNYYTNKIRNIFKE